MLLAIGNKIGFAVQMAARAFKAFERALEMRLGVQLMALYLWFEHELGASKVLGSQMAIRPLNTVWSAHSHLYISPSWDVHWLWPYLGASIRPIHDWLAVETGALHRSTTESDTFIVPGYMFLLNFTASMPLFVCIMQNSDAQDGLGMYHIEEGAIWLVFRTPSDFVAETFRATRAHTFPSSINGSGWDGYAGQL